MSIVTFKYTFSTQFTQVLISYYLNAVYTYNLGLDFTNIDFELSLIYLLYIIVLLS